MPKCPEREYRTFQASNLELRETDNGEKIVEGYATTFNDPYLMYEEDDYKSFEEIAPDAFDGADMSDVIMQYDHQGRVFARMSNNTLVLTRDDHGLRIRASLGGTELGRQLYDEIKGGYTTKMSFAFVVGAQERTITRDHDAGTVKVNRRITKVRKVYDVSAVSLPANPGTAIYSRGDISRGELESVEEELRAIRQRDRDLLRLKILMEV